MELPRKHHTFKSAATRALFKNLIKQMAQNATIDPEWNDYFSSTAFLEDIDCPTTDSEHPKGSSEWSSSVDDEFLQHLSGSPDWQDEDVLSPLNHAFSRMQSFSTSSTSEQETTNIDFTQIFSSGIDGQDFSSIPVSTHSSQAAHIASPPIDLNSFSFDRQAFDREHPATDLGNYFSSSLETDFSMAGQDSTFLFPLPHTTLPIDGPNIALPFASRPPISRSVSAYPSTTQSDISTAPSILTSSSRSEVDSPHPDPAQVLQALDPATQRLCLEIAHKLLANSALTLSGDHPSTSAAVPMSANFLRPASAKNGHRRSGSISGPPPLRRTMSDQARLDFMETKKRGACLECRRRKRKCNPSHVLRA